ncbi:MAG TPA: diguanylate cyclase [Spirochaetia bacterium]|nr:diguanylate cyclase [Spirochaetia bacterium]
MREYQIVMAGRDEACINAVKNCVADENMHLLVAPTRESHEQLTARHEIDLLMLDISIPDGFERQLLRETKAKPGKVPVIVVASLADLDQEACQIADEFLSKPIVPLECNVRLKSVLGLKKLNDCLAEYTKGDEEDMPAAGPLRDRPRILIVDDSRFERMLFMHMLAENDSEILTAADGEEALTLAEKLVPDLIILDVVLPGMDGYEVCGHLKSMTGLENVPVLMVTALEGTEARLKGLEYGADDYLKKPVSDKELQLRVRSLLKRKGMHDRLLEKYWTARQQATLDSLTGLANHGFFQKHLAEELERARRFGEPLGLLMIDVDSFKQYNDLNGHPAGDVVLKTIARLIREAIWTSDLAARYGGEEFAVILPRTDRKGTLVTAGKILRAVFEHDFPHGEKQPGGRVTISIGAAAAPPEGADPERLVTAADEALYEAKGDGKNCVKIS